MSRSFEAGALLAMEGCTAEIGEGSGGGRVIEEASDGGTEGVGAGLTMEGDD